MFELLGIDQCGFFRACSDYLYSDKMYICRKNSVERIPPPHKTFLNLGAASDCTHLQILAT